MGSGDSKLAFGRPPTVILMTGLQGSGKTTTSAKLALHLRKDGKKPGLVAADLQRPGRDRPARAARQADRDSRLPHRHAGSRSRRERRPRAGEGGRARRRHRRHGRPAQRRRGADGRARPRPRCGQAAQRPARARRDDGTGSRQRRRGVPGARRLRRRRADEARRRCARRRRALRQGDHRQADQVRVGRREARPARGVPPRPDGLADSRDG